MIISWYGQSCFRIEGKGGSILIDRFSKDIGLREPKIKDNILLVTHDHYDHGNVKDAPDDVTIISGPGEYDIGEVYIGGILSYHDNSKGSERGLNTIYIIRTEGINICHMGDFGQSVLEDDQLDEIGEIDILMIPVGGKYTIDAKQAVDVIRKIEPKIIIPMHYKIAGLNLDIDGPEKFIKEIGLKPENVEKFRVTQKTLPQEEMQLVVFGGEQ